MAGKTKLVVGASGFLGSHVTRQLVERGDDVRVLVRETSSTRGIDDLPVDRHCGDIFDAEVLQRAMRDCEDVFYCVVDTRAWLRDPTPLFETNVKGLRHVLDAAGDAHLRRFVFTSTIGTIALSAGTPATEDMPFNWAHLCGAYIRSRLEAENLVLRYADERGLPAVAMCISNTYGPRDWQPKHGALLAAAGAGKMPFYIKGVGMEVVGIEDAARAMILAAERGRVGERYIISERFISARELYDTAADAGGVRRARFGIPLNVLYAAGSLGDLAAKVFRRDMPLSTTLVRLMHIMSPMDHSKASRELGWQPRPIHESVHAAVAFYRERAQQSSR